jgi:hypothetical protein
LIINGQIKLKRGNIARFTQAGVEYEDGSTLAADVIICATG